MNAEELKERTKGWSLIIDYAREKTPPEVAGGMEQQQRRRLEKRMTLFQQELAKLPEPERLRMSSLLSEKLITALSDLHIAVVTLNGILEVQRAATPAARAAASQRSKETLDDVMELYGI